MEVLALSLLLSLLLPSLLRLLLLAPLARQRSRAALWVIALQLEVVP
jgi:hypothetical protein